MVDENIYNDNKILEDKSFLKLRSDKWYYVNFLVFRGVFTGNLERSIFALPGAGQRGDRPEASFFLAKK